MFKNALAVTIFAMTVTSAQADIKSVYTQGFWDVSVGTPNNDTSDTMCVLQTEGNTTDTKDYFYYGLKYFQKENAFVIHIAKGSWKIPSNVEINYQLEFDNLGAWNIIGAVHENDETMLESTFNTTSDAEIEAFIKEFSIAHKMTIKFPGNELLWHLNMKGSSKAADVFAYCVKTARGRKQSNTPTQPFDEPKTPTQPFTTKPVTPATPSQPFVPTPTNKDKQA